MELVLSILQNVKNSFIDYFLYFIGGVTPQMMVLLDFIVAHSIMHIMLSVKLKQILPIKNHYSFIEKRIACIIIIGVAQSVDVLTNINAVHNVVMYYFIALEGTYIINIARELGLPIPEQLSAGVKGLGNYQLREDFEAEKDIAADEADKYTDETDNLN